MSHVFIIELSRVSGISFFWTSTFYANVHAAMAGLLSGYKLLDVRTILAR